MSQKSKSTTTNPSPDLPEEGSQGDNGDVTEPLQVPVVVVPVIHQVTQVEDVLVTFQNHISKLEADIPKVKIDIQEYKEKKKDLEDQVKVAEEAMAHFSDLEKSEKQNEGLRDNIEDDLRERLAACNRCLIADEERLAALEKRLQINYTIWLRDQVRLLDPQNEQFVKKGITTSAPKKSGGDSGLVYFEENLKIAFGKDHDTKIGLMEIDTEVQACYQPAFKRRNDIDLWEPCEELKDAWSLLDLKTSDPKFFDSLVSHLPKLSRDELHTAWHALNFKYTLEHIRDVRKNVFQQLLYTPFFALLAAAAGGLESPDYRTEQEVSSSLSILWEVKKENPSFRSMKIAIMADAAVTLGCGWDVFGIMEVKRPRHGYMCAKRADSIRIALCQMMTATTAITASRCIKEKHLHQHIAIPLLLANKTECSLYVTTLDKDGIPRTKVVKYPDGSRGEINDLGGDWRRKIFVAFAVLLNKFLRLFETNGRARYQQTLHRNKKRLCGLGKYRVPTDYYSPNFRELCFDSYRESDESDEESYDSSVEQAAPKAASCGEMFSNVKYPFLKTLMFTDWGCVDEYQMTSPFYFKADMKVSTHGMLTPKKVFLKVWKAADANIDSVISEWVNHRHAFKEGVPVATPALDEIAISTSPCGLVYLVFAAEHIDKDSIQGEQDFLQYCKSLIETVLKLHMTTGLLHGDLKPSNVCWADGIVRLIDFGHSQKISSAVWRRSTKGYEAPEILNRKPCSTKTDAFSVGATILQVMKRNMMTAKYMEEDYFGILYDIILNLTASDPDKRWSLAQALETIQNLH